MFNIKVIGIDLGKSSFHLVAHDYAGREPYRKRLTRVKLLEHLANIPRTIIAMESCGGSHWLARQCQKFGHEVKLIPPQYVKPYVKTNKNDYIDADAIAEAAMRPNMRFVSIKTESAQVISVIQKIRSGYIKERTACMSRIGAILLEFGLSLPTGHSKMKSLFQWLAEKNVPLPPMLMQELIEHHEYYQYLNERIVKQNEKLKKLVDSNSHAQLLMSIPGVGTLTAAQCLSDIPNINEFKNGRHLAAWLGLVPRQYSTGGKPTLLGISKRGNKSLRTLFIHGARAILSRLDKAESVFGQWVMELRAKKPFNVAVVALANKLSRIAWSVLKTQKAFEVRL